MSCEREHKVVEEYVTNKMTEIAIEINALPISNQHKRDCVTGMVAFLSGMLAAADNPPAGIWRSHAKH